VVDGVDDVVESRIENLIGITFSKKRFEAVDLAIWVDGLNSARHGGGFLSANLTVHRVELAIDVGDADFVEVNHRDLPDS